ncbi:hypothetical protein L209DRAFT_747963 [Thermothelomyces heterothallicus CBS 203.75]
MMGSPPFSPSPPHSHESHLGIDATFPIASRPKITAWTCTQGGLDTMERPCGGGLRWPGNCMDKRSIRVWGEDAIVYTRL